MQDVSNTHWVFTDFYAPVQSSSCRWQNPWCWMTARMQLVKTANDGNNIGDISGVDNRAVHCSCHRNLTSLRRPWRHFNTDRGCLVRKAGFTFRCLDLSWESKFLQWALAHPGVWGDKWMGTQVTSFLLWGSMPCCLAGKASGSRLAPVSAVSWSHFPPKGKVTGGETGSNSLCASAFPSVKWG